jgi:hypothetical protein
MSSVKFGPELHYVHDVLIQRSFSEFKTRANTYTTSSSMQKINTQRPCAHLLPVAGGRLDAPENAPRSALAHDAGLAPTRFRDRPASAGPVHRGARELLTIHHGQP